MLKIAFLSSAVIAAAAATSASAAAQDSAIPNLASVNFGWQPTNGFDFRPLQGKVAPVGSYRGPRVASAPGQLGFERMADAENPNLKPWATEVMRKHNEEVRGGHRAFGAQARCWPGGTPGQLLFVAEPVYFIQTPHEVWIIWQRNEWVRRVYLDREHSENPKPSWFGESVGRYENGELVVDTIGFVEHPFSFVDNYMTPHTKDLHVEERWKITDGGKTLEATVMVDDPGTFNAPWWGTNRWTKVNRPITESICAENNLNYEQFFKLPEYPMPHADAPDF